MLKHHFQFISAHKKMIPDIFGSEFVDLSQCGAILRCLCVHCLFILLSV